MIRRVVSAVATLLIAWLGLLAPTASALAIPDRAELTSTHASHHHPGRVTDAISERGPPETHDRTVSVHSAADRWSRGASVLPDGLTRPSVNAYNATAGFVSTARGSWITEERVGRAMPALVVVDRSSVAANAGARMADGLIGVPQAALSRAIARLQGLRLGDKSIVQGVDAFGSRAGSTFRGRGPTAGSDLDLLVRIDPTALGGRSGPWIQRTLRSIADDFKAEAGFPLSIHAPGNIGMFEKSIPGATFVPLG